MLEVKRVRTDFPILKETVHGYPLVYLDNAATTQKPQVVLDRILDYYSCQNGNIHRGAHFLSELSSAAYESVRESVRVFINAKSLSEIVFTRGATESINLVAASFGREFINPGDEIIVTQMEHHSNIVPWQELCKNSGAVLKVIPMDRESRLVTGSLDTLITEKTRLISVTYVSNVLGVVNPVEEIIATAHAQNVPVLVDAAQAVQHMPLDVQKMDCDFLVFSGHKMYAATGIGVLYGKEKWLEAMPPYQFGGGMISQVSFEKTSYAELPFKFEAGTGNVAAAVSLDAAIGYLKQVGLDTIYDHENDLLSYALEKISAMDRVILYGNIPARCGVVSFNLENVHHYDVGMILDKYGIAVRTGMHCAEPLMSHLGVGGTIRASFALYNTREEIDKLVDVLEKAQTILNI